MRDFLENYWFHILMTSLMVLLLGLIMVDARRTEGIYAECRRLGWDRGGFSYGQAWCSTIPSGRQSLEQARRRN